MPTQPSTNNPDSSRFKLSWDTLNANLLVLITSLVCVAVLLSAGKLAPGRIAHR